MLGSYDKCSDILRDGVRDELASNNSKKHRLVKHQQFCSMAKEHKLSESNIDDFGRIYSSQTASREHSSKAGGGVRYGIFGADAEYGEGSKSGSTNIDNREHLKSKRHRDMLSYYRTNCGSSAYQEMLEEEAHLMTRIANTEIVESWSRCMARDNFGVFAYPLFQDDDLLSFAIKVVYLDFGTSTRYVNSVKLRWFGDNIKALASQEKIIKLPDGYETGELLENNQKVVVNSEMIIQMRRACNAVNDAVQVDIVTADGAKKDVYFLLPKVETKPEPSVFQTLPKVTNLDRRYCRILQKNAYIAGAINEEEFKEYQRLDIVPVPAFPDEWRDILYKFPCSEVANWGNNN